MLKLSPQRNDLLATFLNYGYRLVSSPVILLLIPIFLTEEQQGYWYLFSSLAALSIFADLGFSNIIMQFSAHEYAFLRFDDSRLLEGDDDHLIKLGSFLRFSINWLKNICLVVFPIIYIIGIVYFLRDGVLGIYIYPWTLYAVGTAINFFNNSLLSFIEGMDRISEIQNIRAWVAVANSMIVIIMLVIGGNVYALASGMILSSSLMFIFIFGRFKKLLRQLLAISKGSRYNWKPEVMPFFMRYAISCASGYFIFQIYTPAMHYFHGPVYGGKVGITISLVTATFTISNIWMYTITPKMNMLIARNMWSELDVLFKKRLRLSLGTYFLVFIGLAVFLYYFKDFWLVPKITSRFLPAVPVATLFFCYFLQLIVNAWALYLRGHKQEPLVIPSVLSALWIGATTVAVAALLSPSWFFIGWLSASVWGMPVCYWIYRNCRLRWHGDMNFRRKDIL
jgi:O-antigen/teichoic acid export membrane protein